MVSDLEVPLTDRRADTQQLAAIQEAGLDVTLA